MYHGPRTSLLRSKASATRVYPSRNAPLVELPRTNRSFQGEWWDRMSPPPPSPSTFLSPGAKRLHISMVSTYRSIVLKFLSPPEGNDAVCPHFVTKKTNACLTQGRTDRCRPMPSIDVALPHHESQHNVGHRVRRQGQVVPQLAKIMPVAAHDGQGEPCLEKHPRARSER